ncbi:cache domain-containing protein [Paracoccus sp. MC1854]|uniref:cache domain-containing protein n=1 Tax=Paracoccus sp. MC1854 TaxID=2760306 RepID=UPI0016026284|nr:cache domain-containing protein [Paracoccus sp. MC1854]MBB1492842.1 cache domain-containing protein [Paracoccus sp. MC1854]
MTAIASKYPALTLGRSVFGFVLITLAAAFLILAVSLERRSNEIIDDVLDRAVRVRTSAAATSLARVLERDWQDLGVLAERAALLEPEVLRGVLDGMQGEGDRISWIGYTDINGRVVEATQGMLVGQDVSQRPWFRGGLNGSFAGDVHDALLLAKLMGGSEEDPIRFIDLARPVHNAAGQVVGVVGMHINADWLANFLTETARSLELALFLISANGDVVASSTGETPNTADLQILRVAQTGQSGALRETWPDGQDYFGSLVPNVTFEELPSFGWRMLGRMEMGNFAADLNLMRKEVVVAIAAVLAILAVFTALYVRIFVRPFSQLADSADRIAGGSEEFPPASTSTHEAAKLGSALTRLQRDSDS